MATVGSSSIMAGITGPSMTVPFKLLERTSRSAVGSALSSERFRSVTSAPISWHTFNNPARVGLMPTFLISTSELGRIRAAARK